MLCFPDYDISPLFSAKHLFQIILTLWFISKIQNISIAVIFITKKLFQNWSKHFNSILYTGFWDILSRICYRKLCRKFEYSLNNCKCMSNILKIHTIFRVNGFEITWKIDDLMYSFSSYWKPLQYVF